MAPDQERVFVGRLLGDYLAALRTRYGQWLIGITIMFMALFAVENYYLHAHNFRKIEEADEARNRNNKAIIAIKDAVRLLEKTMDPVHDLLVYHAAAPERTGGPLFLAELKEKAAGENAAFSELDSLLSTTRSDFPPDILITISAETDYLRPRMLELMEIFGRTGTFQNTGEGRAGKTRLMAQSLEKMQEAHHHLGRTIGSLNRRIAELKTEFDREAAMDFEEQAVAMRRTKRGFIIIELFLLIGAAVGISVLGKIIRDDERIKEEEERYRKLLDLEGDAIFVADAKTGVIVDANRRAEELLGIPRDRIIGMHQTELHPPESREEYARAFRQGPTGKGPLRNMLVRRRDGRDIPVEIVANTSSMEQKPVIIGIFRDMSYYVDAERKLRENANFLNTLLDAIPGPIFYKDTQGRFLGCNRSFEEWFLVKRETIIGKTSEGLFAPEYAAEHDRYDRELIENPDETRIYEGVIKTGRGDSRNTAFYKTCFYDSHGSVAGLVGVVLDITNRKEMESQQMELVRQTVEAYDEAQKARQDAEEANRLKSEFLANMSHELRTPLTSVLGYAHILTDHHEEQARALKKIADGIGACAPTECRDMAGIIDVARKNVEDAFTFNSIVMEQGKHLLKLINDLMDLSMLDAGMMRTAENVSSARLIVHATGQSHGNLAQKKGLVIRADIEKLREKDILFMGDAKKIEQVLGNLVQNAIKYSERGEIVIGGELAEGRIIFRVSDEGVGISERERKGIFENFQQIDGSSTRRQGGLGMGLAIAKKLAKVMGGDLDMESTPGAGSVFRLSLPYRPTG